MKIFTIIKALPLKTFKSFSLFLQSPFHNTNKRLVKMLEIRGVKVVELEAIHQQLFPGKRYNKQVFKNLASEMLKMYKKFLAISLVESDEELLAALTYRKIKEDGLEKQLGVNLAPVKTYDFLSQGLLTFQIRGALASDYLQSVLQKKKGKLVFHEILNQEFLLQETNNLMIKVKFYCNYLFFKKRFPDLINIAMVEEEMTHFYIPEPLHASTLLDLYFKSFLLARDDTYEAYIALESLFKEKAHKIHRDHFEFFLGVLVNYCIQQLNAGDASFNENIFEIEKLNLQIVQQIPTKNFPTTIFNNFVIVGCRIGKMQEVYDFMIQNKDRLEQNAFYYNSGLVKNYQKKYDESLQILSQVEHENFNYTLNTRHLIIRNLVELNELEVALNNIESLRIFIARAKDVYTERKKRNLNFLKYYKACIKLKTKKELVSADQYKKLVKDLKSKIIEQKNLFTKEFLISYLEAS